MTRSSQLESIFFAALEKTAPAERLAYLDDACEADGELRHNVERLLAAQADAGSFLESPVALPSFGEGVAEWGPSIDSFVAEGPGSVVGPYKLLQQIGEGGMGVVFMAEQTEPIQRTVALKIIKPGMDTRQVIARFEAERQALAMMDHPNIARVLDAGTTGGGSRDEGLGTRASGQSSPALDPRPSTLDLSSARPYFVMELVKGIPITHYCDQNRLAVRQRLALFAQVCHAVQHAHQKGIIHRDLKPSNVLVAEYDDKPVPKVIDFGVAKATAQRLTDKTMFTAFGQLIGTFEYMSPEQAKFNQLDIDTRSDIYSLGVLLYELLTGTTPLERHRLETIAFDETLRIIREEEPPRPSTRLSQIPRPSCGSLASAGKAREGVPSLPLPLGEGRGEGACDLPLIATNRHSEPAKLSKEIRGELDWIAMKCLEKDRNRRYETAAALAADIQHYLSDEPVTAVAPSRLYRTSKFVRRNKLTVIASFAVMLGLVAGVIGMAIGLVSQSRQRSADERERAESQFNLANALQSQAKYADAEALYRKGLEANLGATPQDRQRAARTRLRLAQMADDRGDKTEAERLHRDALAAYRGAFSPGDPNIAQALGGLAEILQAQQRFAESEPLIREAHEIHRNASPADHFLIATSGTLLGNVLITLGRHAEAEPILLEAIAEHELVVPPDKLALALTRTVFGRDLIMIGKFPEAERQLLEAEKVLSLTTHLNYGQVALASLYSRWDQTEPQKGYDAKARHWFDDLIDAFLVRPRPPSEPPAVTGEQAK